MPTAATASTLTARLVTGQRIAWSAGLVRTPDGQAYEIMVRPASLAKHDSIRENYTTKKG